VRSYDRIANLVSGVAKGDGSQGAGGIPGEDKDLRRYSIPIHSEEISTLPAMVRMLGPYKLSVVDGVTCLITDIRNTNTMYKAPSSIDFNIDGKPYRATSEYIGDMQQANGVVAVTGIVPIAGLTFLGATTKEAYFYSAATRMYYSFGGGRDITKRDIFNRFRDLKDGKWDFVNQEVMFKCLLGNDVLICRLDGQVLGEVYPPNKTVYSERSDFKLLSMPGGLTYQGPKRFAVNRFIINEHMYPDLRDNKRRWTRVSRYEYNPERDYGWEYEDLDTRTPLTAVYGWVHNPFRLVTSMLGTDEETDSRFEWDLTFAWTENMDMLYEKDEYATVNIMAETVTQGGTKFSEVTHVFLFKECFTREGCAGYYTYQFQSNNGIGNRERLYIWSDSLIALEDLQQRAKQMTGHRMNPAFTQIDVKDLKEQ
jgi:hypothetical protein